MGGVVLECAQFGDFDSFDVIRSLTSMAGLTDAELPTPIATGLLTMYYVDTTVVEGGTYYYKFRVWRDGVALVSDEKKIKAVLTNDELHEFVTLYAPFTENYIPVIGEETIFTLNGSNCSIQTGQGGAGNGFFMAGVESYLTFDMPNFFNTEPFCIDFYGKTTGSGFDGMASFGADLNRDYAIATLTQSTWWLSRTNASWTHGSLAITAPQNTWHHFAFSWDGAGTVRLFVNGVLNRTATGFTSPISQTKNKGVIGKKSDRLSEGYVVSIQHLRLTKGHVRYTGNFAPQTEYYY